MSSFDASTPEAPEQPSVAPVEAQIGGYTPLLATKFYLPRPRSRRVTRARLLSRLEACLQHSLTLLAAPAGYGKTTLLAEWLHHPSSKHCHVAWLELGSGDSEPLQFLRYVISALQMVAPDIGAAILPSLQSVHPASLQPLLYALANDLTILPDNSVLVLDDYHVIDTTAVHQALTFLLDNLPPQLHLLISTRVNPPLPLARLRARGQLMELRAADLRFTTDEAATFLQDVIGLPISADDVAALEARTEGWIAGLQLAAISLQELPVDAIGAFIDSFTGSHRFVVDYLVDDVLASQPAVIQEFLLHTSILDHFCAALCAAVVGSERSECQLRLEQLERANLFIVPLDDERRWYRYHHLFAQVLHERLLQSVSHTEFAALHVRAAAWRAEHGFMVDAIQHLLTARAWEEAAYLVERQGWLVILNGQRPLVQGWLGALPETVVGTRPYLLELQAGLYFLENDLEAAERTIESAETALGESRSYVPLPPLVAYAVMMHANIARARGDIAHCVELSHQALALLSTQETVRRSVSTLGAALAFHVSGEVGPSSERVVIEAVKTTEQVKNLPTQFNAMLALAELRWMQGHLQQAAASYFRAGEVAPNLLALHALNNGASYYCGLGAILYEWNRLEESAQLLRQGVEIMRGGLQTHADIVTSGYITQARLQQIGGDSAGARATLHELRTLAQKLSFATHLHRRAAAAQAYMALLQGDLTRARSWVDGSAWLLEGEVDYRQEQAYFTLARIRIGQWKYDDFVFSLADVIRLLERLLVDAHSKNRMNSVLHIHMLRALALHRQDNTRAALESLASALQLAQSEGYVRLFVDEGSAMERLLSLGVNEDYFKVDLRDYAKLLLNLLSTERTLRPSESANVSTAAPLPLTGGESLTARELEVLQLLAVGCSNRVIARELVVEVGTVKRHVSNIMDKLQARSRLEAVARARDLKIV